VGQNRDQSPFHRAPPFFGRRWPDMDESAHISASETAFSEKYLVAEAESLFRTGETPVPGTPPFSPPVSPNPIYTILLRRFSILKVVGVPALKNFSAKI